MLGLSRTIADSQPGTVRSFSVEYTSVSGRWLRKIHNSCTW